MKVPKRAFVQQSNPASLVFKYHVNTRENSAYTAPINRVAPCNTDRSVLLTRDNVSVIIYTVFRQALLLSKS